MHTTFLTKTLASVALLTTAVHGVDLDGMSAEDVMESIRYEAPAPIMAEHTLTATSGGFQVVDLGGASSGTGCIQGDWAFFVRPGTTNKVVIDFEGGGACWDLLSCVIGLAKKSVDVNGTLAMLNSGNGLTNTANAANEISDWTYVYVPYCTGDLFVGSNRPWYGTRHYGYNNGNAVFQWLKQNVINPEATLTTGCSAGGYGAHFWASRIMGHYSNAKNYHLADSAMGVMSRSQFNGFVNNWRLADNLDYENVPAYASIDLNNYDSNQGFTVQLLGYLAQAFPNSEFSHYTTNEDLVQAGFFAAGGGRLSDWTPQFRNILGRVISMSPSNQNAYIAPGTGHCIIPSDDLYSTAVGGISVSSWMFGVINEDKSVANFIDCQDYGSC